jgi:hypothetical protein
MSKSKFDDAKDAVANKGLATTPTAGTIATDSGTVVVAPRPDAAILEPLSMAEFAAALAEGGEMAPSFVEMGEGEQFRAYYMDRLDGLIEEIVRATDGSMHAVMKPVKRLVFELASKDRKGTGVMFSMLEVTQLTQKIGEALPADGSCFVLVAKGGKKETNKKRLMDHFEVISFRNARKPRRGALMLDEKSGLPIVGGRE